MPNAEDWLEDPLMEIDKGSYQYRKLKIPNEKQYQEWRLFHYTTRLKLNGANFFCTKVIDTARTSEDELRWYLDAFFFELMAACDILLQELNIVYAYDLPLKLEGVHIPEQTGHHSGRNRPPYRSKSATPARQAGG